eukprot:TRINITY_DN4734_c0_g1_i1.p1 TRINITY_DN4734_c0_g1~~TRINITY_DN4734_c0_g1_i1.p1  ORF type:complete len:185 (-),score=37.25 TRINITY_DN4734_c0_g1_i1:102-656(-)
MIEAFLIAGLDPVLPVCFFAQGFTPEWNDMLRKKREQFILARLSMEWSFRASCVQPSEARKHATQNPMDVKQMNSAFEEGITELESALFPKNTQALWRAQHGTALIAITSQEVNTLLVSQFLKAISIALSETFKTNIFYNPKDLIMRPDDVVANLSQLAPNGQLMFVNVAFMRQLRKAADAALA